MVTGIESAVYAESAARNVLLEHYRDRGGFENELADRIRTIDVGECTDNQRRALAILARLPVSTDRIKVKSDLNTSAETKHEILREDPSVRTVVAPSYFDSDARKTKHQRVSGSTASWSVYIHRLPIGQLTVYSRQSKDASADKTTAGHPARPARWSVSFTLYPAAWIARTAISLSVDRVFPEFTTSRIRIGLDYAVCNDHPGLLQYLSTANVRGICELLETGQARTTDIVRRHGNSLLHVMAESPCRVTS